MPYLPLLADTQRLTARSKAAPYASSGVRDVTDRQVSTLALALAGDKVLLFTYSGTALKLQLP